MKTSHLKPHNVAIIGYGYWGPILHQYLSESTKYKVSKIFFPSLTKTSKYFNDHTTSTLFTTNINEIWNDPHISSIVIATPVTTHYSLAKTAIEHKKNVFVEKPTTAEAKLTKQLIKLAKENDVQLFTNYTESYSKSIEYANQLVKNNVIGTIRSIDITIEKLDMRPSIETFETLGPHALALFFTLFGQCNTLDFSSLLIDDNKCNHISFTTKDKNTTGAIHVSLNSATKKKMIIIEGTKGNVHINMLQGTVTSGDQNISIASNMSTFDEKNNLRHVFNSYNDVVNHKVQSNNKLALFVDKCLDQITQ